MLFFEKFFSLRGLRAKCCVLAFLSNAVLKITCSIRTSGLAYGQKGNFGNLPVKAGLRLQAQPAFNAVYKKPG